jgi:hypothetical protein
MKIDPSETVISGVSKVDGKWVSDAEICWRIDSLTSSILSLVSKRNGGWTKLYRDNDDGRLWEKTWPFSEMHGGGPPVLTMLSPEEARALYPEADI